jgi:hypothetical protein
MEFYNHVNYTNVKSTTKMTGDTTTVTKPQILLVTAHSLKRNVMKP